MPRRLTTLGHLAAMDGNRFVDLHHVQKLLHHPTPRPLILYDDAADKVVAALKQAVPPGTYTSRLVDNGAFALFMRTFGGWNTGEVMSYLVKNDLIANETADRRLLAQVTRSFAGGESAQWTEVIDWCKDERGWEPIIPKHPGCALGRMRSEEERRVAPETVELQMAYNVSEAGMRFWHCPLCHERVFFDQVEFTPLHQEALFAILTIDVNRAIEEAVLAEASRREREGETEFDNPWAHWL